MRPFVKSNKNDAKDAEAICEAVERPSMRFVAVKSRTQQEILALHRVRSLLDSRAGGVAAVALANKNAACCGALLTRTEGYRDNFHAWNRG